MLGLSTIRCEFVYRGGGGEGRTGKAAEDDWRPFTDALTTALHHNFLCSPFKKQKPMCRREASISDIREFSRRAKVFLKTSGDSVHSFYAEPNFKKMRPTIMRLADSAPQSLSREWLCILKNHEALVHKVVKGPYRK